MLLRAAHWNFTRRQVALTQLKAAVINGVLSTNPPPQPFAYEYAYPEDCLKARFILPVFAGPNTNIPFTTAPNISVPTAGPNIAIPFVVASDTDSGGNDISVILTNMPQAQLIYTRRIENVDLWDPQFQQAMVATLAAAMVNPLNRNAKLFADQAGVAISIVGQARVSDGNEGPQSWDHMPDWIQARAAGHSWRNWGGSGYFWQGWDSFSVGGLSY